MSLLSPNRLRAKAYAKIEPHLHWRVPAHAGTYGSVRWSNPDIDPIPIAKQTWGSLDYWAYWTSDMLAPPLTSTVSSVMSLGWTARETIPLVFFGFCICSVVITLTARIGATYHIPFPVFVRSVFGMYGSYAAICVRAFVAAMWTAILCVQAGDFLNNCITAIWPSFVNFPNHLPESANITSAGLLCFFLYWILQTILACMRIEKLKILFRIKAVIVPPTFLALFLWGAIVTHGGGPLVTGHYKLTSSYMNAPYSALTGLFSVVGLFSSLAVNMPDFARFAKSPKVFAFNQFFALPVIGTIGALCPIFVTAAHSYFWGEFQWYTPAVFAQFDSRAAKFFCSASFILSIIGNQIAAGTYPFSNDVTGLAPRYINIFRATLFISLFCVVSTPWNIIKNAAGLLAFLSGYSSIMGCMAGIMTCDYYIIKKGKLDIHELYKDHGIYHYWHGINWRAFAAFTLGFAPLVPGFAKSVGNDLNVGGAWEIYTFAFLFGFVVCGVSYYVICRWISPLGEALVDVAVKPPQRGVDEGIDVEVGEKSEIVESIDIEKEVGEKSFETREVPPSP